MICPFFSPPEYFIISKAVPLLLYYSYLPALFISLPLGIFIFLKNPSLLLNKLLLAITAFFAVWAFFVLILWTHINSDTNIFFWSFLGILSSLIAISSTYFISVFVRNGNDVTLLEKVLYLLVLMPAIILTPTVTNISGFDLNICGSSGYVGFGFVTYYYLLGLFSILWIVGLLIYYYKKSNPVFRRQIILMGVGMFSFLSLFFSTGYYVNYINETGITTVYDIELYGMFGMVIFIIFIGILIVKFKTFNIKLIATQALVWSLVALIGSQFFFIKVPINFVLNGIGFLAAMILGQFLIKSVKKEVEAREMIQKQKNQLEKANTRLEELDKQKSEFVSFATHQLRSPLTAMGGYASMILEGDYGNIPDKVKDVIKTISMSTKTLASVVESYLNLSRIELGTMKYEMVKIDLKEMLIEAEKEQKPNIVAKGLKFEMVIPEGEFWVSADLDKFKQVLMNTVDNSVKYTPSGSIKVELSKVDGRIRFTVKDTGVGIAPEVMPKLFQKYSRAPKASEANIHGTGLGLFIARQIVEAHGGRVWAESEGEGKGSRFIVEVPEAK